MLPDHTHFTLADGVILTTRGHHHPDNAVRSVGLYKPVKPHQNCQKQVDEFSNDWMRASHPEYIHATKFGSLTLVPTDDIAVIHDPFRRTEQIQNAITDKLPLQVVEAVRQLVPVKDIGFIGSHLLHLGRPPHDLDLLVRGLEHMRRVRSSFPALLAGIGAEDAPPEAIVARYTARLHTKYNAQYNDFRTLQARRWPTIHFPGKLFCKLRFTYKPDEVPEFEDPGLPTGHKTLVGQVVDDEGTCFMPRQFTLATSSGTKVVQTYFWEFSYSVRSGDVVSVRAAEYSDGKTLMLTHPKQHGIRFLSQ